MTAFVATAVGIPAASAAGVSFARAHVLGACTGLVVAGALATLSTSRRRHERAALRLVELLPESHVPGRVHRALERRLAILRAARTHRGLPALEVAAIRALRLAGLREPARALADRVDPSPLGPELREAWTYDRALLRIRDGAYEAAEALLEGAIAGPLLALRALVHSLQGGADQALAVLEHLGALEPEPRLLAGIARGHALASMGKDDEAKKILGALVAEHGVGALAHALRPIGPATDLARALLGRDFRISSVPPIPPPAG